MTWQFYILEETPFEFLIKKDIKSLTVSVTAF